MEGEGVMNRKRGRPVLRKRKARRLRPDSTIYEAGFDHVVLGHVQEMFKYGPYPATMLALSKVDPRLLWSRPGFGYECLAQVNQALEDAELRFEKEFVVRRKKRIGVLRREINGDGIYTCETPPPDRGAPRLEAHLWRDIAKRRARRIAELEQELAGRPTHPDLDLVDPVDDMIDRYVVCAFTDHQLAGLCSRHRLVLVLRFGLYGRRPTSYHMIGTVLGVTRERVRQIEKKALNEIRLRQRIELSHSIERVPRITRVDCR